MGTNQRQSANIRALYGAPPTCDIWPPALRGLQWLNVGEPDLDDYASLETPPRIECSPGATELDRIPT